MTFQLLLLFPDFHVNAGIYREFCGPMGNVCFQLFEDSLITFYVYQFLHFFSFMALERNNH